MKTRNIEDMSTNFSDGTNGDNEIFDLNIFFDDHGPNLMDEIESELGNYSYFFGVLEDSTENERISKVFIINYHEAIKHRFKDCPDCGLLNYKGHGYDLKDMTLKDILNKVFIENNSKEIFQKELIDIVRL